MGVKIWKNSPVGKKEPTGGKGLVLMFSGPETFQLRDFVRNYIRLAEGKYGEENVSRIDPRETEFNVLKSELFSLPFFCVGKRIIVLDPFPYEATGKKKKADSEEKEPEKKNKEKLNEELILDLLKNTPEEVVVICVCPAEIKADGTLSKALAPIISKEHSKKFMPLGRGDLTQWVIERVKMKDAKILPAAAEFLWNRCGTNLWKLEHEVEKLVAFTDSAKPISENDIEKVSDPSYESIQYAFSDAFATRNCREVMKVFHELLDSGETAQGMIYRDFGSVMRNLVLTRFAIDRKKTAEDIGMHPFAFSKTKKTASAFSMTHLKAMQRKLVAIDEGTKTGLIPVSSGHEDHLIFALERWIQDFFRKEKTSCPEEKS